MDATKMRPPCDDTCEYKVPGENWVKGVRYIPPLTPDVMSRFKEFPVHEDDIFVCGYPKVGNVWTTTIVSAILHQDDLDTWKQDPPEVNPRLLDISLDQLGKVPRPTFFYTHLPYHLLPTGVREKNAKIVHVSRDPKDVAVSFYYFHRNYVMFGPWNGSWDVFYDNFISGEVMYGSYFSFVRTYWEQKYNPNVMNIQYENLKRDPQTWIGKLAEFLGKPLDHEKLEKIVELTSFKGMKENPGLNLDNFARAMEKKGMKILAPGGTFFRKGVVGDWRHLFTEEQRRQTDGLYRQLCKDMDMDVFTDETDISKTDN